MNQISAIIPVYNNQDTLQNLVEVVISNANLSEVIVVNDGSSDRSLDILQKYPQLKLISHPHNQGKGAAIVSGWINAKYENICTIDADLKTYSHFHINQLIGKFIETNSDMVIAARDRLYPFGWVSGERIYHKTNVMKYIEIARKSGNGIEQIINHAHEGKKIEIYITKNTGHVLKYERHLPHHAAWFYLKEGWQLAKTEHNLGYPITKELKYRIKKKLTTFN